MAETIGDKNVDFKNRITELNTSTPAHADVFNAIFKDLINNDAVLYEYIYSRLDDIDMAVKYNGANITIDHNLGTYPMAMAHMELSFGVGGFGEGSYGGTTRMEIPLKAEFVNSNTVTLNLDEALEGDYTVSKIDNKNYDVTFANTGSTIKVKLFI